MPSISIPGALLIGGGISAAAGLGGAAMQSSAATNAAEMQYQAAQQAAAQQWAMFQQMQGNLAPYMLTGQNAMNNLAMLTGNAPMVSPEVAQWQQQLKTAQSALAALNGPAGPPGQINQNAPLSAATSQQLLAALNANVGKGYDAAFVNQVKGLIDSGASAGSIGSVLNQWAAGTTSKENQPAVAAIMGAFGNPLAGPATGSNALTPLGTVGATGAAAGPGGAAVPAGATTGGAAVPGALPTDAAGLQQLITDLQGKINQAQYSAQPGNPLTAPLTAPFAPTMAQLEATPGYQFTLQQGLKATQNAATSMGLGQSGPAIAGAADYAAGLASQTYQQQFNNYWANNQNLYNMISGLATMGQNAAAGVGTAGIQTGQGIGNLLTGGAAALGAGQVGAANAWAGGLGAAGGAASNAALLLAMQNNGLFGGGGATPAMATPTAGGGWAVGPGGFPMPDQGGF